MLVVRSCPFIAISYRSYFCSQFELPLLSVIPSLLVVIPSLARGYLEPPRGHSRVVAMLLPAAALREHAQTLLQYLRACVTAGCEIGSARHKELAKEAMKSILKRMLKCTTLDATAATSIIELFKTELLVKEYRDRLVDAVNSKT